MLAVPQVVATADIDENARVALASIPGIRLRAAWSFNGVQVKAPADLAPALSARLGVAVTPAVPERRLVDTSRLHPSLRPWQVETAVALARNEKRLVWHSAGIGKTAIYLAAADLVTAGGGRVLIVTRAIGRTSFVRDLALLTARRKLAVVVGTAGAGPLTQAQLAAVRRADRALQPYRDRGAEVVAVGSVGDALAAHQPWAVVVGWEVLAAHESAILRAGFSVLVLDEHHCGKSYNSRRTVAALRIAAQVPVVWGGTATPVPDRVRDLWGQLASVGGRGAWGTSLQFARRYCHAVPSPHGGWDTTGPHREHCAYCAAATAELKSRLGWWADVRNRKVIAAQLPAVSRALVHVPPDDVPAEGGVRGGIEAAVARAAAAKVSAVATRAAEALAAGERVVVAGNRRAWVPRMAAAIVRALPAGLRRAGSVWLREMTGENSIEHRAVLAAELETLDLGAGYQYRAACLVLTWDCARTSIDLLADRVIVAALPWSPEALEQFEGRFPRLRYGPLHKVQFDYVIAEGTIDQSIEEKLLGKLVTLGAAGAEVDEGARTWMQESAPREDEILAGLHAWLSERRDEIENAAPVAEEAV